MTTIAKRSLTRITKPDLQKLLGLARADLAAFFARHPVYQDTHMGKEKLVALCQGAALHYIDRKNGVKDFDVWFFFPAGTPTLPYRRRGVVDFGPSAFGRHPDHPSHFTGRTVDVLMRSDSAFDGATAEICLHRYLSKPRTHTAKLLSQKAVVGLFPDELFGKVLWPAD